MEDLNNDWLDNIFALSPCENDVTAGEHDVTRNDDVTKNSNTIPASFNCDRSPTGERFYSHSSEYSTDLNLTDSNDRQIICSFQSDVSTQKTFIDNDDLIFSNEIEPINLSSLHTSTVDNIGSDINIRCDANIGSDINVWGDANMGGEANMEGDTNTDDDVDQFWSWTDFSFSYPSNSQRVVRDGVRPVRIIQVPSTTFERRTPTNVASKSNVRCLDAQPGGHSHCKGLDLTRYGYKAVPVSTTCGCDDITDQLPAAQSNYSDKEADISTFSKPFPPSCAGDKQRNPCCSVSHAKTFEVIRYTPYSYLAQSAAARDSRIFTLSEALFTTPIPSAGILMLTDEEKNMLTLEGYPIPTKLPLSKQQEKYLKQIRRKIKNKISAQESRRKKNEYLDSLEIKMHMFGQEKMGLLTKVEQLEASNRSLIQQLESLQRLVQSTTGSKSTTGGTTGLMVLVLFFAAFVGTCSPLKSWSIGYGKVQVSQSIPDTCYFGIGPLLPQLINVPLPAPTKPERPSDIPTVEIAEKLECKNSFVTTYYGHQNGILNDIFENDLKFRPFGPSVPPRENLHEFIAKNENIDGEDISVLDWVPGPFSRPTDPSVPRPKSGRSWSVNESCCSGDEVRGKCLRVNNKTLIVYSVEPIHPLPSALVVDDLT